MASFLDLSCLMLARLARQKAHSKQRTLHMKRCRAKKENGKYQQQHWADQGNACSGRREMRWEMSALSREVKRGALSWAPHLKTVRRGATQFFKANSGCHEESGLKLMRQVTKGTGCEATTSIRQSRERKKIEKIIDRLLLNEWIL